MESGVRYNLTFNGSLVGYFLDGIYYEDDHAIGHLDGSDFHYNFTNGATGEFRFPNGIAGRLDGMSIVRVGDGTRLLIEKA